jgi:hypothetical protein
VAAHHHQREALAREAGDIDRASEAAGSADVFERMLDGVGRCRRCGRALTDPISVARGARRCSRCRLDEAAS